MKKICFLLVLSLIVLHSKFALAFKENNIEIFDPRLNMVVKEVAINDEINTMLMDWVHSIDEFYPTLDPIKDDGYTIRFPIVPARPISNNLINGTIEEVYLIVPNSNPPFFMIFLGSSNPLCFNFTGDLDSLSRILDFKFD